MCETPGGLATRGEELRLSEAFDLLRRPATEDEAYALAYFACRTLARGRRPTTTPAGPPPVASESGGGGGDVSFVLQALGGLRVECGDGSAWIDCGTERALQRVGVAIYRCLDWGVHDDEERELSPALERLIEGMTCGASGPGRHPAAAAAAAGTRGPLHSGGGGGGGVKTMLHTGTVHSLPANGGAEEKPPAEGNGTAHHHEQREGSTYTISQVVAVCVARVRSPDHPERHYSAVLHSLYLHATDKRSFVASVQNLKRIEANDTFANAHRGPGGACQQNTRDRAWASVMEELGGGGGGVRLRKAEGGGKAPTGATPFRLTPFEMLLRDIALRRFTLKPTPAPQRCRGSRGSAHDQSLDYIRSRPALKPAWQRRLSASQPRERSAREKLLADICKGTTLRPLSASVPSPPSSVPSPPSPVPSPPSSVSSPPSCVPSLPSSVSSLPSSVSSPPSPVRETRRPSMGRSRCSTEPKREFAHSLETLTLTLEDVSSIRKVLSCAELDLHCRDRGRFALLDNGKLCFSCQQTKFSLFSRPRTCRLCCRCVCSQCCTKVQLPDKKLSHVPVYALGWSVDPKDPPLHTRNGLSLAGLGPLWAGAAAWVWASLCRDCSQLLDTVVTRSHSSARLLHRA